MTAVTKTNPILIDETNMGAGSPAWPYGTAVSDLPYDPGSCKISGLVAGEALAAGDACYVSAAGTVFRSTGAAANAAAKVDGFCVMGAASGAAVVLIFNCCLTYGSALTPGTRYFLSGTV